jgi:hypothetical protein
MNQTLKRTTPGGTVASPETRAWYAELRRRGNEILAERLGALAQGPLPQVIPARNRTSPGAEPHAQPA